MSVRAALRATLARYDEDALVAWGNRGLLRRAGKDLETQSPVVERDDDDALVLAFAGHTQQFDARGLIHARCSCPSGGACQHLLAAVLWLQRASGTTDAAADPPSATADQGIDEPGPTADTEDPRKPPHAELLAFTAAQLARHAGNPGYRWAWQHVQDSDPAQAPRIGGERNVVIDLVQPRIVFRYLGGGLDQLIADSAVARIEKYRVAAVLAYQRAHDQTIAPPVERVAAPALNLGKDHTTGTGREAARHDSRARLRASLAQLLGECIELGLSHLSRQIHERYATLAVWAQGADYPRLALLLRRIADHIELLLERAGGADEHRLLEELALAHGLVAALTCTAQDGQTPGHLVGRARAEYETVAPLSLWGLGALPWRAASGYVGLTLLFWSPHAREFLACTDARPESQRFDPLARYHASGPWSGLGAPAQATGRHVHLLDAQTSAAGRLSAAASTQATLQPLAHAELRAGLAPQDSWQALFEARRLARISLLSEPQQMRDWVVLQPARYGPARFDAARQVLVWPLSDAAGAVLEAEVPYSPLAEHAIARIETLTPEQLNGQWLVARLRGSANGPVAEPLSLIRAYDGADVAVDALYFDAPPQARLRDAVVRTLREWRNTPPDPTARPPSPRTPAALATYRHWLSQCAERGIGHDLLPKLQAEQDQHLRRLRDAGVTAFPTVSAMPFGPTGLLAHHYIGMQYLQIINVDSLE